MVSRITAIIIGRCAPTLPYRRNLPTTPARFMSLKREYLFSASSTTQFEEIDKQMAKLCTLLEAKHMKLLAQILKSGQMEKKDAGDRFQANIIQLCSKIAELIKTNQDLIVRCQTLSLPSSYLTLR